MRIQVISDLHLEFQDGLPDITNAGADLLVMAGDICIADHLYGNPTAGLDDLIQKGWYAKDAIRYRRFLEHVSREFGTVLYVMGNHEHYGGRWDRTENVLRDECARLGNIHLLEQQRMVIDGVSFLGASLWSDLNDGDPLTMLSVRDMMNDYRSITERNGEHYHKLRPAVTLAKHRETVRWLDHMLGEHREPTVVVTHHAPSRMSIHPRYNNAANDMMNGAFVSNLEHLMMDRDHLRLWVHGHTHNRFDYEIDGTRVVCNPHGYPREHADFDPGFVADV